MSELDIARYLAASKRLDVSGIDFDRARERALPWADLRCLLYMMDIESHTIIYLKDLLNTKAAQDPEVTAFLSMWVYEEFWHGEALGQFLRSAGVPVGPERAEIIRATMPRGNPVAAAIKTFATKHLRDFIAIHMTWGAINELSTLSGYQQVIARTQHPVLTDLLSRIVKDERRHYAFYFNQARVRLDGNPRAQRLVRWALDRFWAPVGTGVRPQAETDHVVARLFGDSDGARAIARMEEDIRRLPGLGDVRVISRARDAAVARVSAARPRRQSRSGRPVLGAVGADGTPTPCAPRAPVGASTRREGGGGWAST